MALLNRTFSELLDFTRATTATFVGSNGLIQTAAIDAPRFAHDPVTLEGQGLLVEGARTNLLLNSATLSTQNVTGAAEEHTIHFTGTGTITLSGTFSGTLAGTGTGEANRVSLTFTPTAGTLTLTVSGSVVTAQLEQGSFITSYIPTTSAQVTRAVDSCIRMLQSEYNAENFTAFFEYKLGNGVIQGNLSIIRLFGFSDGTNNNRLSLIVPNLLSINAGNLQDFNLTENLTQSGKVAIAYNGTTVSVFLNGSIIFSDLLAPNFSFDRMFVGASQFTNAGKVTIKRQALYPKALSEEELISITGGA